jgi:hypothetical protein
VNQAITLHPCQQLRHAGLLDARDLREVHLADDLATFDTAMRARARTISAECRESFADMFGPEGAQHMRAMFTERHDG